jgi:hypothetical protein
MYKTTLSLRPRAAGSTTQTCEPGLFDEIDLGLNETGKPWSPMDPPLADIPEAPPAESDVGPHTYHVEPVESPVQEPAPVAESDITCDDDTVFFEDYELSQDREPTTVAEPAVESPSAPEVKAEVPIVPEPVAFIDEPLIDEPLVDEPLINEPIIEKMIVEETTFTTDTTPVAATAAVETAVAEAPVVETPEVRAPAPNRVDAEPAPLPPMTAFAHERCATQRQGVVPKRIGSGRLVPAKLTWKPRDPFACPSKPKAQRFRWELMLTAACITAVCGLGCVWILRTLLA